MNFGVLFLVMLGLAGCASPTRPVAEAETDGPVAGPPAPPFIGMRGCFLLYNLKTGAFDKVIGEEVCREPFPACSTFKVPLAVMAFDSGVLADENVMLKWDGKVDIRPQVNQNHDAKTWMRDSVVWFSQRLTPKIGEKKLKKYLKGFKYGNQSLAGGITQAWLISPNEKDKALSLSAYEQTDFMKRLWTDKLPVSKRAMELTRQITFLETSPQGFGLSGKTGSGYYDKNKKVRLGWFIGHLKNGEQEYLVATTFSDLQAGEAGYGGPKAKELTKGFLTELGLW